MTHQKTGTPSRNGQPCPLCHQIDIRYVGFHGHRDYWSCRTCHLIFIPSEQHIPAEDEKKHYDFHTNHPADPAYRAFLNRLFLPMHERIPSASRGLDFGSGPGPTLSVMFEEAGHTMSIYDCFYAPSLSAFGRSYDFITATEVVEHLHHPGDELTRLWSLLNAGGTLGVMTQLVPDNQTFFEWYYLKDPTHVCFFSRSTWEWVASQWRADLVFPGPHVMLLSKPSILARS